MLGVNQSGNKRRKHQWPGEIRGTRDWNAGRKLDVVVFLYDRSEKSQASERVVLCAALPQAGNAPTKKIGNFTGKGEVSETSRSVAKKKLHLKIFGSKVGIGEYGLILA